ncbi:putative MFS transporter [Aspergillus bertholletiae]|uniref:Putative MFS transporter n=1 Tax=Aspergillus bertholletiae TaxID=1226010 RepID=A0A5N7BPM4_9EURO|nr:putative MFS transporter [Aspergillus bertholletiae]
MVSEHHSKEPETDLSHGSDASDSGDPVKLQEAPLWRKCMIVFSTSWITMSACFSSTLFLSTVNELTQEFDVPRRTFEIANAAVLLAFGMSSLVWTPIEKVCGRPIAYNCCIVALLVLTIIAVFLSNSAGFIAVRILSGFQGTYFHVAAQTIFADYFPPTQRGTATGFFLAGVVLGSPLGPLVGAVIVTYKSWRVILWLQTAMVAFGLVLSVTFIQHGHGKPQRPTGRRSFCRTACLFNPLHVLKWWRYPNILTTSVACGFLSWAQFSLLAVPRHVIEKRFQLHTPILSGLFYLAPTSGFVVGTILGGRLSDRTVKWWVKRRNGLRLPEDRLRSGVVSFFIVIPAAYLGFGWGIQCDECSRARLAAPIVTAFFVGVGVFDAMTGLNTYCSEALPKARRDVIASKYFIQYTFSAVASAVATSLIDAVGLGPACTIDVVFVLVSATLTASVARRGSAMQRWAEGNSNRNLE